MATTTHSQPTSTSAPGRSSMWREQAGIAFQGLLIPFLSVFTAVLVGSVLILLNGRDPITAFEGLFEGAFLEPRGLLATFRNMTPLLLSGLAVAFAFKSGLLNIGVQGQLIAGSVVAAWIGFAVEGLPPLLHITLAIVAAVAAALLWPVFRRAKDPMLTDAGEARAAERERLETERMAVLTAIRELDLDQQTGKITEDDHADRRAQLVERGVAVLKAIDQLSISHD